jgi:hypothetical protein
MRWSTILVLTAAVSTSSSGLAQDMMGMEPVFRLPPSRAQAQPNITLESADADHDGKVSQAEWLAAGGSRKKFRKMDVDQNGYADKTEFAS